MVLCSIKSEEWRAQREPGKGYCKEKMEVASLSLVKMQYRSFLVKKHQIGGAAWVLRNHRSLVLLHSKKSFSNYESLDDAKRPVFVWAIESMVSHKAYKVIFASDAVELIKALDRS